MNRTLAAAAAVLAIMGCAAAQSALPEGAEIWETAPYEITIEDFVVDAAGVFSLDLAPSGGTAVRFVPVV